MHVVVEAIIASADIANVKDLNMHARPIYLSSVNLRLTPHEVVPPRLPAATLAITITLILEIPRTFSIAAGSCMYIGGRWRVVAALLIMSAHQQ
eukprot:scaffold455389_cov32-Prasinocladus_malaysianus.AAC.1